MMGDPPPKLVDMFLEADAALERAQAVVCGLADIRRTALLKMCALGHPYAQLSGVLGISPGRIGQMVKAARAQGSPGGGQGGGSS